MSRKLPKNHEANGDCWDKNKGYFHSQEPEYSIVDNDLFHIGQGYDNRAAQQIKCNCGCDKFYVGEGDYYTAIKCSNCELELCIHEG